MSYDAVVQAGRRGACGGCVDPAPEKGPARVRVPRLGLHRRGAAGHRCAAGPTSARLAAHAGRVFSGAEPGSVLQVLGIALVAQLAADTCKEAGLSAAATAIELCGRVLALLQALPLLQSLLGSFAAYLQ